MVFKTRHIWCCIDILAVSKVIGFLSGVFAFLQFMLCGMILVSMHLHLAEFEVGELHWMYVKLAGFLIDFVFCIVLIRAVYKKNRMQILPWLIYRGILLCFLIPYSFYNLIQIIGRGNSKEIFEASVFLILICVAFWAWVTIYVIFQYYFEVESLDFTKILVIPLSEDEKLHFTLNYAKQIFF